MIRRNVLLDYKKSIYYQRLLFDNRTLSMDHIYNYSLSSIAKHRGPHWKHCSDNLAKTKGKERKNQWKDAFKENKTEHFNNFDNGVGCS